jgi:hypothetical protein
VLDEVAGPGNREPPGQGKLSSLQHFVKENGVNQRKTQEDMRQSHSGWWFHPSEKY